MVEQGRHRAYRYHRSGAGARPELRIGAKRRGDLGLRFPEPETTYSYTFKVPGTYQYFCTTHVKEGMKGEIDVEQ